MATKAKASKSVNTYDQMKKWHRKGLHKDTPRSSCVLCRQELRKAEDATYAKKPVGRVRPTAHQFVRDVKAGRNHITAEMVRQEVRQVEQQLVRELKLVRSDLKKLSGQSWSVSLNGTKKQGQ